MFLLVFFVWEIHDKYRNKLESVLCLFHLNKSVYFSRMHLNFSQALTTDFDTGGYHSFCFQNNMFQVRWYDTHLYYKYLFNTLYVLDTMLRKGDITLASKLELKAWNCRNPCIAINVVEWKCKVYWKSEEKISKFHWSGQGKLYLRRSISAKTWRENLNSEAFQSEEQNVQKNTPAWAHLS